MKDIDYYMSLPYRLEILPDQEEGGFAVFYPELKGCISEGSTIEEAVQNALDAKREWLLSMLDEKQPIPEPDSLKQFSGNFRLRIPKELHRQLYYKAKASGVSMNQYCTMLLSRNDMSQASGS